MRTYFVHKDRNSVERHGLLITAESLAQATEAYVDETGERHAQTVFIQPMNEDKVYEVALSITVQVLANIRAVHPLYPDKP